MIKRQILSLIEKSSALIRVNLWLKISYKIILSDYLK